MAKRTRSYSPNWAACPSGRRKMRAATSVVAFLLVFGLIPMGAASQERWGALLFELPNEHNYGFLDHIPRSDKRCLHVAGIAWNYPTRREAIKAAREDCRAEWRKSGIRVPLRTDSCGDLKFDNPITTGTVVGVIFGTGQCAAYATGPNKVSFLICPVSGTGINLSKSEAELEALGECNQHGKCQIKLSVCNASR